MDLSRELLLCKGLARTAGAMALRLRADLMVDEKPNGEGAVTNADIAIDDYICGELKREFPQDLIISEESFKDDGSPINGHRVWFIDPIDGTKGYVEGNDDFVVMIGLAIDAVARMGVVYQPVTDKLWCGIYYPEEGCRWAQKIEGDMATDLRAAPPGPVPHELNILASRSRRSLRQQVMIEQLCPSNVLYFGSVGLKAMMILERHGDLYVAWSKRIKLWDTCAPTAIVRAAGANIAFIDGEPLVHKGPIDHGRPIVFASFIPDTRMQEKLSRIKNQG